MHLKQKTSIHFFQAAIAILPLVPGALIYLYLRPVKPVFIEWLKLFGLENSHVLKHFNFTDSQMLIPDWIIFSLPSGLWAFAYSFIINRIWNLNNSKVRVFWIASIPVFIFGPEVLQLTHFLPGTYSFFDMVFSAVGMLAGYIIALKLNRLEINQ